MASGVARGAIGAGRPGRQNWTFVVDEMESMKVFRGSENFLSQEKSF